ncbi:MAG: M23 family metallopeptidase [Brumimicrobium sp.]
MKNLFFITIVLFAVTLTLSCNRSKEVTEFNPVQFAKIDKPKNLLFGFDLDYYDHDRDTVKSGMTWSDLFSPFDVSTYVINTTVERLKDSLINLKYLVAGRTFVTFKHKEEGKGHIVYEPDPFSYITFEIENDSIEVIRKNKPIEINERTVTGIIEPNSNLSVEMSKNFDSYSMTAELASYLEGIYAWSIDFFRLQPNDKFIIVYDEKSVDGKAYGVEDVKYAWFEHSGQGLYAFYYKDSLQDISGWYNENGEEMKRPFLKAPVQYSRISSSFNLGRFHPVLKRKKAHLGTDYAAPTGTPIYSTADGTITKAGYTGGNGNYVKVRHNKTYETQYLHMSRIKEGIRPGVFVKQGDVIGYVGQTGLATGPHVCYRFWKNGKQIDPRSEKFPKSEPMKEEAIPQYLEFISPYKAKMDEIIQSMEETQIKNINI